MDWKDGREVALRVVSGRSYRPRGLGVAVGEGYLVINLLRSWAG
jgi:hypothetical protein